MGYTHWGDVKSSTVAEIPQHFLHEQHLQFKITVCLTGFLEGFVHHTGILSVFVTHSRLS